MIHDTVSAEIQSIFHLKAGALFGGSTIDPWYEDFVARSRYLRQG